MHTALPNNVRELVHNGANLEITDEVAARWGDRPYFKVSGVSDVLRPFGLLRTDIDPQRDLLSRATENVPADYRAYFPGTSGSWMFLGRNQVAALSRIREEHVENIRVRSVGDPQTLDRAICSVNYLCYWVERRAGAALPPGFVDPIKIVPLLWTVAVEPNSKWSGLTTFWEDCVASDPNLHQALVRVVRPNPPVIVAQALKDPKQPARLSYRNAYRLQRTLTALGYKAALDVPTGNKFKASNIELLDISRKRMHAALRLAV